MKTMTRERPILFSGPMVRAILDGRKSVTRRIVKLAVVTTCDDRFGVTDSPCPFGVPGDRLWVREGFALACHDPENFFEGDEETEDTHSVVYREGSDPNAKWDRYHENAKGEFVRQKKQVKPPWRPSIFMPRWASRLTLEVVSVRVERLVDGMNDAEARAEGFDSENPTATEASNAHMRDMSIAEWRFSEAWEAMHGTDSWCNSPWIWRIEFKPLTALAGRGRK